jgi:hypothetical protein
MADVTVTAADVRPLPGFSVLRFPAAGALNVGDAVYLKSDGTVDATDADAAATAVCLGIIVGIGAFGKTVAAAGDIVDVQVGGVVTGFSGLTIGGLVYLSTTAAKLADARPAGASGDFVFIVGIAISATSIKLLLFTDSFAAA